MASVHVHRVGSRRLTAMRWQIWFISLALGGIPAGQVSAQRHTRPPPQYSTWGEPDQDKGRSILREFRNSGLAGDYLLNFTLETMGSGRERREVVGVLYGSRNEKGPVSLIEIDGPSDLGRPVRYLIQNGPEPFVWRSGDEAEIPELMTGGALLETLFSTDVTPFDLQLPYLFWEDFIYEGQIRFRGRPTNVFLLYPPAGQATLYPGISGVRLYLDSQFNAMMQAEILDESLEVRKTVNLLEIKKVDGQWLAKVIDVRMPGGVKTRFRIKAVSMACEWASSLFNPLYLHEDLPLVDAGRLTVVR